MTAVRTTHTKGRRGLSPDDFPVALGTLIHLSVAVTTMDDDAGELGAESNETFSKRKVFCVDSCVLTHICFGVNFSFLVIHLVTLISFKKVRLKHRYCHCYRGYYVGPKYVSFGSHSSFYFFK